MTFTSSSSSSTGTSSSSSSNLLSSSSSSGFCRFPECSGEQCIYFSNWNIEGGSPELIPDGAIYVLFNYFGGDQQIELYSDPNYYDLIGIGRGTTGVINFLERNDSGISGSVTWDGTAVNAGETAILYCDDISSSSSTSSLDSSSSSSESSHSSESSSSDCCENLIADGADSNHFSSWVINGMKDANSDGCTLYIGLEYISSYQQLKIYKDRTFYNLVAIGQSGVAGSISLTAVNASGLSGSVDWDGTPINYPSIIVVSCSPFSSSSSMSSNSFDSSSSSSIDSSSSSTSNSSSSSTSSLDSSSSSSSSSVGFSSSLSTSSESISSRSSFSTSSSSSESIGNISSSSSTESVGNISSSSSSSLVIWNKSKPLAFANAVTGDGYTSNKIAQSFKITSSEYNIGKIYLYLNGPFGDVSASTIELSMYFGDENGLPETLIKTVVMNAAEIDRAGWYSAEFNMGGVTPDSQYFTIVASTANMDNNNYITWVYNNATVLNSPAMIYQDSEWQIIPNICRSLRVNEPFDVFNLNEYKIETLSANKVAAEEVVNGDNALYSGTKYDSNSVKIDHPNTILSFVVDSSGSMGWNDRNNNRIDLISKMYDHMSSFYPSEFLFDMVGFGAIELNTSGFNSLNNAVSFINMDANAPTRTTYIFALDAQYELQDGAVYETNSKSFTVCSGGNYRETLYALGEEDPATTSGTLTKISGGGSSVVNYSEYTKATIKDGVVAYGLKNMNPDSTYVFGGVYVDNVLFFEPNLVNSDLFGPSSEMPILAIDQNGPSEEDAINISAKPGTVFRKSVATYELESWPILNNVDYGTNIVIADGFNGSILEKYDLVDGNVASTNLGIENQDENDPQNLTVLPASAHTIIGPQNGGIIQLSAIDVARQINGTTINLLIKEEDARPATFFMQTVSGLYIEWDVTPFSDWIYNNLFWFGESANLSFSAFDKNGNPFPDGTQIDILVNNDATNQKNTVKKLTKDVFSGEDTIYLENVDGILKDAIFDIVDDTNIQSVTISEIGEDAGGKYVKIYETVGYDYLIANNAQMIDKQSNITQSQISGGQEADLPLAMVDVTPIFTNKDLDAGLLKSFDGPQVPSYENYNNLNYLSDYFKWKTVDVPSIDGFGVVRILPITEDNVMSISEKQEMTKDIMKLTTQKQPSSQLPRNEAQAAPQEIPDVVEAKDYALETPVFTTSGIAKSTMTSFSTVFEEKQISGINIPGLDITNLFTTTYSLTPRVSIINYLGNKTASMSLAPLDVDFAVSTHISSINADNKTVYYWRYSGEYDAESPNASLPQYIKCYFNGVYATGNDYNIDYRLSEKLNLVKSGNLVVRVYANYSIDLEKAASVLKPASFEGDLVENPSEIQMSKQFLHVPVSSVQVKDANGNISVQPKNSDITEWRNTAQANTYSAASQNDLNYYTNASEWVLAKQFDNFSGNLDVVNGIASLNLASSDKPCMLMIEVSTPLATNSDYEVVNCDFVIVANPIVVGVIEPFSAIPNEIDEIFDKSISVEWMGGSIEDGVPVQLTESSTPLEPSIGLTLNGNAGGFRFGPKPILLQKQGDIQQTIVEEEIGVYVYHSSGFNVNTSRKILWKAKQEEQAKYQFFIHANVENETVWADGEDAHEIQIDLNSATNKNVLSMNDDEIPSVWVGEYGSQRLLGLEQSNNEPRLFSVTPTSGVYNFQPDNAKWKSQVTIKPLGVNKNIGHDVTEVVEIKTSYSFTNSQGIQTNSGQVSTETPVVDPLALLLTGEQALKAFPPKRIIKEPLSILVSLEEYDSSFVRDGVSTGTIVAEVKWKNNFIKPFVKINEGRIDEITKEFPFPAVTFRAGTCIEENLSSLSAEPLDPRGPASACLTIKDNEKIKLDVYSTKAGLYRTDIHDDGFGNIHTHSCIVDESGNGATTGTIVLAGTVPDHTHLIENYEISTDNFSIEGEHVSLRCVAICTLYPVTDTDIDININAYATYDPTNCDPVTEPSRFAEPKVEFANRKVFDTLEIKGALGTQPRLSISLNIGGNLNSYGELPSEYPELQPDGTTQSVKSVPQFYTAKSIGETIKGFDLKAYAYYSSYMNGSILVPEEIVPDGTRILIKTEVFKADPSSTFDLVEGTIKPYIIINIKASVSLDGEFASDTQEVVIVSRSQWLPGVIELTSSPTNDSINIANALAKIESFGASQMYDGLVLASQRALQYVKDNNLQGYKHIVFLLSDGDENASTYSLDQAISNIGFISGNKQTPVVCTKLGKISVPSEIVFNKITEETDGLSEHMVNFNEQQIDDIKSRIFVNNKMTINNGIYSDTIDMEQNVNLNTFSISDYIVSTTQGMTYRIRSSMDGDKWGSWSEWLDIDQSISGSINYRYIQYEVFFSGDDKFSSPSLNAGPALEYIKPRETVVFFNRIGLNLNDNQYVNSVHITHEGDIPSTSNVVYGITSGQSVDLKDYYGDTRGWISPNEYSILLSRFREQLITDDGRVYYSANGRWPEFSTIEVFSYSMNNPQGVLVDKSEYASNSVSGKIIFNTFRKNDEFLLINIELPSELRLICKITNSGEETVSLDHIGLIYSIGQRA